MGEKLSQSWAHVANEVEPDCGGCPELGQLHADLERVTERAEAAESALGYRDCEPEITQQECGQACAKWINRLAVSEQQVKELEGRLTAIQGAVTKDFNHIADLTAQLEAARAENNELKRDVFMLENKKFGLKCRVSKLLAERHKLADYVAHQSDCGLYDERVSCTCGYPAELLAKIVTEPRAALGEMSPKPNSGTCQPESKEE
jgi:hypothetical protein